MPGPIRDDLRALLTRARLDRDRPLTAAVRNALAAIDNAEAVEVTGHDTGLDGAGVVGVGATEVARRSLGEGDDVALVRSEVADLRAAATMYAAAGRAGEAEDAERCAERLESLLAI